MHVNIHQHVWPDALVEELRRRSQPPRLDGWTLLTPGEPPFEVNPADHDAGRRARHRRPATASAAWSSACQARSASSTWRPRTRNRSLTPTTEGVAELGAPFAGWAAACLTAIDAPGLAKQLDRGFVGLQLPATAVADESGYRWCGPLLDVLAERDLPLFIHPGPAAGARAGARRGGPPSSPTFSNCTRPGSRSAPTAGRYPRLRVCFTALAGLGAVAWRAPGRPRR